MSAARLPLAPVDPRALALAEQLAEESVAEPFRPLPRCTARRVGSAAVGRGAVPDGLEVVVLGTAKQTVRLAQWQTFALPAFVLLEAGNAVVSDGVFGPWTWGFVVLAALMTGMLVWTVHRERAADAVFRAGRVDQRVERIQPT